MRKIILFSIFCLMSAAAFAQIVSTRIVANVGANKAMKGDSLKNIMLKSDTVLYTIYNAVRVAPSYAAPTAGISSTVTAGNYEIGSALNSTLSSTFTQNNAGAVSTTTYLKNSSPLGGNTDNIASLTAEVCYQVAKAYAQGACLNDNLGVQDCTGRINAGSIASSSLCLTPQYKRFFGYSVASSPTDANIKALANQSLLSAFGSASATFTSQSATYLVISYPASWGDLTSISLDGFPSISAFTKTTRSFVNAQGYTYSANIYVSNNPQTFSSQTFTAN